MKKIILFLFITNTNLFTQVIIPPPKFEFSGTKIRWSMQGKCDCPYDGHGLITDQEAVHKPLGRKLLMDRCIICLMMDVPVEVAQHCFV